jgi:hypothetical protein
VKARGESGMRSSRKSSWVEEQWIIAQEKEGKLRG